MREAGKDKRGESFVKGLSTQLSASIAENKAIKATTDKYMEDLGGIENMNLIEPSQKGAVTDFLRTKRDEFNSLATQHAENPSSELRDKMDAIKFQFQTVNNQLKLYMDKRKEYLSDRDEGNLLTGINNEENNNFFESVYGNPEAAFSIDYETGKISFTGAGNETKSLEDFGDHSIRNYEAESTASTVFSSAKQLKYNGRLYDKNNFTQQFIFKHRGQSADEIQSLIQTDLSGDNYDYGFMQQWANGNLKDKSFYEGFEKNKDGKYDASWMLENSNKQQVLDAFGKFVGNVGQAIYDAGASKPKPLTKTTTSSKTDKYGGFAYTSDTGGDSTADISAFTNVSYSDKVARRKSLLNLETIPGAHYDYKYDENTEGGWAAYDGTKFVRNMNGADVARIEGLMSMSDKSFSVFNQEKVQKDLDQKDLKPKTPGTIGLGVIKFEGSTRDGNIKDIEKKMYDIFDDTFKENFIVSAAGTERGNTSGVPGGYFQPTQNKIKITSKDGNFSEIYDVGPNATQATVDKINKDFADYIMAIDNSYQDEEK